MIRLLSMVMSRLIFTILSCLSCLSSTISRTWQAQGIICYGNPGHVFFCADLDLIYLRSKSGSGSLFTHCSVGSNGFRSEIRKWHLKISTEIDMKENNQR
jgi:hypothetical protein